MDGASPRPPTRRPLQGRQQARLHGRFIQGIRSLGPLGSNFSIPCMRAPRQPTIEGSSSVPSRESTRSTWNASGSLSGLRPVGDRQRFARVMQAAARRGSVERLVYPSKQPTADGPMQRPPSWQPGCDRRRVPSGDAGTGTCCFDARSTRWSVYEDARRGGAPCDASARAGRRLHEHVSLQAARDREEAGGGGRSTWNVRDDVGLETRCMS